MRIVFSALFERDFADAQSRYADISPQLGANFRERVKANVRVILQWKGGERVSSPPSGCSSLSSFPSAARQSRAALFALNTISAPDSTASGQFAERRFMKTPDAVISRFLHSGGRIQVRSALNPCLWMCAIVAMPCLVLYAFHGAKLLLVFAAVPVGLTAIGFLYLLFVDRDKLQSEDFQIRKQSLELIQQKGMRVPVDTKAVERISNPELPSLPALGEEVAS